jgi:hypothetical protein
MLHFLGLQKQYLSQNPLVLQLKKLKYLFIFLKNLYIYMFKNKKKKNKFKFTNNYHIIRLLVIENINNECINDSHIIHYFY